MRYDLESAAGCHITGPVALRRSLSTGLPILLFLCGILHKNHKTFFFFVNNPKASLASCTKAAVFVWHFRIAASPRGEVFRLGNDGVFPRFFVEICQVL